jgi:hypothetical protein
MMACRRIATGLIGRSGVSDPRIIGKHSRVILFPWIKVIEMRTLKYTFWQDGDFFIGFLNDYPDYSTQGMSREELVENLKDLLVDVESGEVPYIRQIDELLVA